MPARSFVRVEKGLYVESPSACFVHEAGGMALPKLVELGFELCGSYALDRGSERGFRDREPLASVDALRKRIEASKGEHGVKRAAVAVRYLADGSASPMESITVALLCLPRRYGGYGLPLPQMNRWIDAEGRLGRASKGGRFSYDLCWPEQGLAVEYDSDRYHTGSARIAGDSRRRTALALGGLSVVTVTRIQLFDARQFDEVARLLAKRMGRSLRAVDYDWMTRRYRLRQALFDSVRLRG
ncbi:hypothetical protein B5F40_14980 [Gordonibacter sp. An230]|uniref:hypothetical protein n=1 Tax=Gordonibacter sp. An230 TaxID=1965592 RepID=UPI000B3A33FE|nr:hypothetical protein [Gordonibacter sp. An230]OUO86539.1 hypothetical protein B5F40_14980 [Gordonibacter sp. An230]